jgi:hypothetical protein
MRIPQDVILIWTGLNSNIPSGWTRETSLDDKFPKAWGSENPDVTGGALTHSHTVSPHTHTINSHTHTGSTGNDLGGTSQKDTSGVGGAPSTHYHNFTSSDVVGGTVGNSSNNTYNSASNLPNYYEVIFIKSGGTTGLPNNVIAYFDKSNIPLGWQECNGANGSPDLRGKYLKGAPSGADAGGTGGSNTHTHTLSHNHSISHYHTGTTGGAANNRSTRGYTGGGANNASPDDHVHSFTLNTVNETSTTYNATSDTQSNEPLHKKLIAIQNKTGNFSKPKYIIGLWLGDVNNIPKGWVLCDGNNGTLNLKDYFIKIANNSSEIGTTGGNNSHGHGAISHSHTATSSHSHSASTAYNGTWGYYQQNGTLYASNSHYHDISSTSSQTTSLANSNIPASSTDDNQPPYRTVAYIQFQKEIYGGGFLLNFL